MNTRGDFDWRKEIIAGHRRWLAEGKRNTPVTHRELKDRLIVDELLRAVRGQ